jgi:hypothetical protein
MAHSLNIRSKVDLILICLCQKGAVFLAQSEWQQCFFYLCRREWELERRTQHGDQQTRSHFVSVFAKGAEFLV